MKKNTDPTKAPITCIVGSNTEINGNITAKEPIRIEGIVNGDVSSSSTVIIGSSCVIAGNVSAACVSTGGKIKGDITVSDKLELLATAAVKGNITAHTLVIDENAIFEGNCHMIKEEADAVAPDSPDSKPSKNSKKLK